MTTLDGAERTVSQGDGLICDADDRPIGLAGVMGGLDTEIGPETVDVLLEAAWWDAPSITRTCRDASSCTARRPAASRAAPTRR